MRSNNICGKVYVFIFFLFLMNGRICGQGIVSSNNTKLSDMTVEKSEKLAEQIAKDFGIRKYIRDKIVYEDYSPVTNEQRYCEDSRAAKDILKRSKLPDYYVVYALVEYDADGYFIVFGQTVLNNPSMMVEAIVHEMAHMYCTANGLNQGKDEHSDSYTIWFEKIYDYVFTNMDEILQ